jgi:hypothetical protein
MISSVNLVIFSAVPLVVVADLGGGGGQRRTKGSNLRIKVKLTLEVANGVEKK